ncbi:hypothetical protein EJ04DRAFT_513418 [Polyplosphaeria fusca]|uniref:Uncharacterized protein n=1 Tax=Polyplosphaeria fusca TaxID=682080 RepID=A0A9P4QXA2_9PLEO|nr:hypothetical protein EJ04DRAFT_513418 [Polyplosphaeria fusca]
MERRLTSAPGGEPNVQVRAGDLLHISWVHTSLDANLVQSRFGGAHGRHYVPKRHGQRADELLTSDAKVNLEAQQRPCDGCRWAYSAHGRHEGASASLRMTHKWTNTAPTQGTVGCTTARGPRGSRQNRRFGPESRNDVDERCRQERARESEEEESRAEA